MNSEWAMFAIHRHLLPLLWVSWVLYWWALSLDVKVVARRESLASRLTYIVPLGLAVLLLMAPQMPIAFLGEPMLPLVDWPFWLGSLLTAAGLAFTLWARKYIGRNWSAIVAIKEGHELVTGGPYALVRHPIYAGLLVAFVGSAIARGEWRGALAVALAFAAFWYKLRLEEKWMYEQFGGAYLEYRRRVAALIPFLL